MLTGDHIATMLRAAGTSTTGKVTSLQGIADLFNDAMINYGGGQFDTTNKVAALISECMMESAWFRTTEEYSKIGRYAPYIGRTFIQITWKDNYASFGKWCVSVGLLTDPNYFVNNPASLADLKWAALGGVWYFTQVLFAGKPLTAYADDMLAVGRAVNLGSPTSKNTPNGQKARDAAYKAVAGLGSVIVPEVIPVPTTPQPEGDVKYSKTYKSDYVWFRGGNVPPIVEKVLLAIPSNIQLSQGGLSNSVPASGQTHNGLGAYDISVKGWSKSKILTLCAELIRSGEVAFPRGGWFGSAVFSTHVHVCSNNSYDSLHQTAKDQVKDFKKGKNGLVGHGKYVGPKTPLGSWKDSPYNPDNIREVKDVYYVQTDTLLGLDVDRNQKEKKKKGDKISFVRQVKRWGRWNAVTSKGTYFAISDGDQIYLKPKDEPTPVDPPVVVTPPVIVDPPVVVTPNPSKVTEDTVKDEKGVYYVQTETLLGLDKDRKTVEHKVKGDRISFVRKEYRWDRWNVVTVKGTYFAIADGKQTYLK